MTKRSDIESELGNFSFLLFTPNPERRNVKVYVDDGEVSFLMNYDKFLQEIGRMADYDLYKKVESALCVYGGFYQLDRHARVISKLKGAFATDNIARDIANLKNMKDTKKTVIEQYDDVLSKNIEEKK